MQSTKTGQLLETTRIFLAEIEQDVHLLITTKRFYSASGRKEFRSSLRIQFWFLLRVTQLYDFGKRDKSIKNKFLKEHRIRESGLFTVTKELIYTVE